MGRAKSTQIASFKRAGPALLKLDRVLTTGSGGRGRLAGLEQQGVSMANIKVALGFVARPDGAKRWGKAYAIILAAAKDKAAPKGLDKQNRPR